MHTYFKVALKIPNISNRLLLVHHCTCGITKVYQLTAEARADGCDRWKGHMLGRRGLEVNGIEQILQDLRVF